MKRWRSVVVLLLLSGIATGCFSKDEERTTIQPNTAQQGKNDPTNSTRGGEPAEKKEQTVEHAVASATTSGWAHAAQAPAEQSEKTNPPSPTADTPKPIPTPAAPAVTEEEVASKYKQELNSLRAHFSGQLQSLYSGAIADVKANQAAKKAIYSKYAKKALAIQEDSQAKVNQVLARMKEELSANQLPADQIQVYRNTYYSELNRTKSQAMAKVKKALGMQEE